MNCPRCGGYVEKTGYYEPACINCGYAHFTPRELAQARGAYRRRHNDGSPPTYAATVALDEKRAREHLENQKRRRARR